MYTKVNRQNQTHIIDEAVFGRLAKTYYSCFYVKPAAADIPQHQSGFQGVFHYLTSPDWNKWHVSQTPTNGAYPELQCNPFQPTEKGMRKLNLQVKFESFSKTKLALRKIDSNQTLFICITYLV